MRALVLIMLGITSFAAGQSAAPPPPVGDTPIKVGIFPFADATASGNRSAGTDIGRTMASEVTHTTTLVPRMLAGDGSTRAEDLDGEQAIAFGREQKVDLVFMGTMFPVVQPGDVLLMIVGGGMKLAVLGVAVGIAASLLLTCY